MAWRQFNHTLARRGPNKGLQSYITTRSFKIFYRTSVVAIVPVSACEGLQLGHGTFCWIIVIASYPYMNVQRLSPYPSRICWKSNGDSGRVEPYPSDSTECKHVDLILVVSALSRFFNASFSSYMPRGCLFHSLAVTFNQTWKVLYKDKRTTWNTTRDLPLTRP